MKISSKYVSRKGGPLFFWLLYKEVPCNNRMCVKNSKFWKFCKKFFFWFPFSLGKQICRTWEVFFYVWLTVHRSITLADLQLDAQNSYLFTYNTFIKILYMFRALRCPSSGGLRRNCIYAASGIVTLCRWLFCAPVKKELQFFLSQCTRQSPADSDDTRGCIYTITT